MELKNGMAKNWISWKWQINETKKKAYENCHLRKNILSSVEVEGNVKAVLGSVTNISTNMRSGWIEIFLSSDSV